MSSYPYRIIDFAEESNSYFVVWTGKDQREHNALIPAETHSDGSLNATQSLRSIEQHIKLAESKALVIPDGRTLVGTNGTAVENNDDAQSPVSQPPEDAEDL